MFSESISNFQKYGPQYLNILLIGAFMVGVILLCARSDTSESFFTASIIIIISLCGMGEQCMNVVRIENFGRVFG